MQPRRCRTESIDSRLHSTRPSGLRLLLRLGMFRTHAAAISRASIVKAYMRATAEVHSPMLAAPARTRNAATRIPALPARNGHQEVRTLPLDLGLLR